MVQGELWDSRSDLFEREQESGHVCVPDSSGPVCFSENHRFFSLPLSCRAAEEESALKERHALILTESIGLPMHQMPVLEDSW